MDIILILIIIISLLAMLYIKIYNNIAIEKTKIEKVEDNKIVVTLSQKKISRVYYSLIVLLLCGEAYCESIWQVRKIFFKVPFLKVYVDVHGVVPEEEFLYQRYEAAQKYGDIELVAVQKSEHP